MLMFSLFFNCVPISPKRWPFFILGMEIYTVPALHPNNFGNRLTMGQIYIPLCAKDQNEHACEAYDIQKESFHLHIIKYLPVTHTTIRALWHDFIISLVST